jgi:membrane protease YdiL (CAAX protease family)
MNYLTQALRSAPVLIILSMIFILIEFNIPPVFTQTFGRAFNAREPLTLSFMVIYSLIFLLLVPLLINRFFFKEPLSHYGLNPPAARKKTFLLVTAALLIFVPASIALGQQKPMQLFYSMKNFSYATIAFDFLLAYPPYYLAEEFFFRGFLFLRLERKIGWHSYWITELIFMWAHLGKPPIEILFSFPAGLILNYLTFKTRSIFPAMGVHYVLGVVMTFYVTFFV